MGPRGSGDPAANMHRGPLTSQARPPSQGVYRDKLFLRPLHLLFPPPGVLVPQELNSESLS